MCNLYSITTNQAAIAALFRVVNRYVGNLAPMLIATFLLCLWCCSTSHAQECTPPADQFIGILFGDGRCFPWPKKNLEKYPINAPRCTPELKGQLETRSLPEIVNGEFVWTKECVPIELLHRPDPPRSTTLDDMQRSIDELSQKVDQLKSERH